MLGWLAEVCRRESTCRASGRPSHLYDLLHATRAVQVNSGLRHAVGHSLHLQSISFEIDMTVSIIRWAKGNRTTNEKQSVVFHDLMTSSNS